jgi:pimeloyl-ACP methyl ester carboxylesterase
MSDHPAVLLVHGAWHGPWCWERVVPLLEAEGVDVHLLDLPSMRDAPTGMIEDAAAVRSALEEIGGPVLAVAHSYGGIPVTDGAAGAENLVGLVYFCAFMLDEGQSLFATVGGVEPDWWVKSEDGLTLGVTDPTPLFYNDCDEATAAAAAARLRPLSRLAIDQPVRAVAWRDVPSTYVICDRDGAFPVPAQEAISQNATRVERLDTSHSPFLSQPDAVARIILGAL